MSKSQEKNIFNGKIEAEKIIRNLKDKSTKIVTNSGLAVILVGQNKASQVYVAIKEKRAKEIGVNFFKYHLPETVSEQKIINLIKKINQDKKITGLMVQLPLPKKLKTNKIIQEIDTKKDVDGLVYASCYHPELVSGSLKRCRNKFGMTKCVIPPTIQSIIHLIKLSKQKLVNKKAVILCNSQEFVEPLRQELEKKKIKVDACLSCGIPVEVGIQKKKILDSRSWSGMTNKADIIIVALGKKHFIKPEMIKKNAIIIDVGINRVGKKIFGDVDPQCLAKTKYITPVPGGVGPLTVAYLFKNLLKLKNPS